MLIHFVTWAYGPSKIETVAETDAALSFDAVVSDIWSGQVENVVRVVALDTATGVGSDVTKAVALALASKSERDQEEPYYELIDFIEANGAKPYRRPLTRWEIMEARADDMRDARMDMAA